MVVHLLQMQVVETLCVGQEDITLQELANECTLLLRRAYWKLLVVLERITIL